MSEIFNNYSDESCHLENDHQKVMVLDAIWSSLDKTRKIAFWQRKLLREYVEYRQEQGSKNTEAAPKDGFVTSSTRGR